MHRLAIYSKNEYPTCIQLCGIEPVVAQRDCERYGHRDERERYRKTRQQKLVDRQPVNKLTHCHCFTVREFK